QLPSHQPQATDLGSVFIAEEPHRHGLGLPDPPTASAGLPESEGGISGFVPDDGRAEHQIKPSLNKAGMTNKHLDAGLDLALIPGLSFLRRCLCSEHRGLDTGIVQNRFNPAGNVPLLGVRRINLYAAPVLYLRLNQFDKPPFFGIYDGFIKV